MALDWRVSFCPRTVVVNPSCHASWFVQVISSVLDDCNGDLNEALEKLTELSLTSNCSEQCGVPQLGARTSSVPQLEVPGS
jgi:hypothetical protein